ncbi:hypothetical protein A6A08_07065 [Nocardiopsis sp. TSRI0078]|nr:hypothetical protein A6A08_07065 [Nocardiopsis sp. TSRI0078]
MCYLCRCELDPTTRGNLPTGMAAHITAHGDAGPRAAPAMSIDQRNSIDNLVYLCPSCHSRIDKNSGAGYSVEELLAVKERHESWTRSLRQAGSAWNVRYHHVDFVNIPRLAVLPGADEVLRVSQDIGLDPNSAFRNQGMLAGVFVKRVKPIFENWGERALDIDPDDPVEVRPGMVVSFNSPMRARNIRQARNMARISGSIRRDPHLCFAYGDRTAAIRFDPIWLTTMTSLTTLGTAEREAVTYAGLGTVVAVTEDQIQISAMVFGQPENGVNNLLHLMSNMSGKGARSVDLTRMVDSRSAREAGTRMKSTARKRVVDAVLYFDELHEQIIGPEPMEEAVFSAVAKAVPEYRRDIRVGWASLTEEALTDHGYSPTDVASHLIAAPEEQWSSFSVPRLGDLISRTGIAYALLRGVEAQCLDDLNEILTEVFRPYRGGFQLLTGNRYHKDLHNCLDKYRIYGGDLRVLYSAADEYGEGLDESVIEYWNRTGLFSSVEWEEDEARSRADEEEARRLMEGFLHGL